MESWFGVEKSFMVCAYHIKFQWVFLGSISQDIYIFNVFTLYPPHQPNQHTTLRKKVKKKKRGYREEAQKLETKVEKIARTESNPIQLHGHYNKDKLGK